MNWSIGLAEVATLLFLGAMALYLRELSTTSKVRGVLRAGYRAANKRGYPDVRIDKNQVAELIGEDLDTRSRDTYASKFDPIHPAMRAPARRRKLKKGA